MQYYNKKLRKSLRLEEKFKHTGGGEGNIAASLLPCIKVIPKYAAKH